MAIADEIKDVAVKLEKSLETAPPEELIKTLFQLGPDGIKEKFNDLSKSDGELLKATLEYMKKAVEMDENYAPKYGVGNVYGGKGKLVHEDKADDEADEKLVKPEAAKQEHQGDQTPKGRDDNKVEDPKKDEVKKGDDVKKMTTSPDMNEMISKMKDEGKSKMYAQGYGMAKGCDPKDLEKALEKAFSVEGDEKSNYMKKAEEAYMHKMKDYAMHKMSEKYDMKKMKDGYMESMKDGHMKKAEEDYMNKMKEYAMSKMGEKYDMKKMKDDHMSKAEGEYEVKKGHDTEGYGKNEKPMEKGEATLGSNSGVKNPEEGQVKDNLEKLKNKTARGDKARPEELKTEKDNKTAQDKVDNLDQKGAGIKKSISWPGADALIKSGRGGQNHHFSVNDFYNDAIKTVLEIKSPTDTLEKSKTGGINGMIERKEDSSRDEVLVKSELAGQKRDTAKLFKSFELDDMVDVLQISKKEAAEILG